MENNNKKLEVNLIIAELQTRLLDAVKEDVMKTVYIQQLEKKVQDLERKLNDCELKEELNEKPKRETKEK